MERPRAAALAICVAGGFAGFIASVDCNRKEEDAPAPLPTATQTAAPAVTAAATPVAAPVVPPPVQPNPVTPAASSRPHVAVRADAGAVALGRADAAAWPPPMATAFPLPVLPAIQPSALPGIASGVIGGMVGALPSGLVPPPIPAPSH
jgi:hypothetical protein